MDMHLHPICTGPCAAQYSQREVARVLQEQQNHYALIRYQIERERIAHLTPHMMRAELADLDARIKAARQQRGSA